MRSIISMASAVLLAALFCACESTSALLDLAPAKPSDLTVEEVIERIHRVTDPKGVYAKAKSYIMKQNVDSTDRHEKNTYTSIIYFKAPDKLKQVSYKNGKPFNVLIAKEEQAWYVNPKTGKSTKIPEGTPLNLVKAFNGMVKPGVNFKKIFKSIKIDMKDDPRTMRTYYRLICRVEDHNIAPYIFYIDSKTFLTKKFETVLYGADGSESLYTAYSENYVWQQGVRKPTRSLITVNGKTDISTVTSFDLNVDIADSEFDVTKPWNQTAK